MDPKDVPSEEVASATDEFFKQRPVLPLEPKVAKEPLTPPSRSEEGDVPSSEEDTAHPSVVQDYVRELQQEFEHQEKEGKI
jgi:hypothetical protein